MKASLMVCAAALLAASCSGSPGNESQQATSDQKVVAPTDTPKVEGSYDGPFGLKMGEPVSELHFADGEDDLSQARLLDSVPRPMAELEKYAVLAYPDVGVCEIRSVSKTFDSDAYGNNIRPAMDELANLLDSKYGAHRKMAACSGYSCQFFQMNLKDGSQVYAYEWSKATGAHLPPDISDVSLGAMAGDFNNTFYRLDYTSSKKDECNRARERLKAKSL
jgi:hypothetical protein